MYQEKPDLFARAEDCAPNLGVIQYIDDPNYICCAEVPKLKRSTCFQSADQKLIYDCLTKRKAPEPIEICPKLENEHDILFRPLRWRCKKRPTLVEKPPEPSLGEPIGVSASTFSMSFLETEPTNLSLQGFATVLVGYAEYFITPEVEWDDKVLNRVLLEGQRLYKESSDSVPRGDPMKELSIKRTFMLCDNAFDVMVGEPFLVGRVVGNELKVPNLHWGLTKFFKKFQFCLLQIGSWYVLLWKNAEIYFIFDCFGRRPEDFKSDRKRGVAVLVCLREMENVSHLLLNLSGVQPTQLFTIRPLQLKSLIPCGGKPTPEIIDRVTQYEVVYADYAMLRANVHLGSRCFKEIRYRHSLPVAIAALVNAKIDPTPSWDRQTVDKILKLGANLYKQWTQCDFNLELGIQDVPREFHFGQFTVQIAVTAIAECGLWKCTPNFIHSDLSSSLLRALARGHNLILQIQGRFYAIWKKGSFYYLLDPYAHTCSLGKEKLPTGSLRMCGGFDRICCVVTQSLLDLFEESKFIIHLVKIVHLEELSIAEQNRRRNTAPCMCLATPQTDAAAEVVSLNESVFGPDGYECSEEPPLLVDDAADLDSPGMSQTRLGDYAEMRKGMVDASESESDEGSDVDLDGDELDVAGDQKSDESDEGEKKEKKKEKKEKPKKEKKVKEEKAKETKESEQKESEQKESKQKESEQKESKQKESKQKDGQGDKVDKAGGDATDGDKRGKQSTLDKDSDKDNNKDLKQKNDDKQDGGRDGKDDGKKETVQPAEEPKRKSEPKAEAPRDQDAPDEGAQGSEGPASEEQKQDEKPRRERRKRKEADPSSGDEKGECDIPVGCKPNKYPGFTEDPHDLAVIGSESGSYESLCSLLKAAFRVADRVLTMTPWGNYVAFRFDKLFLVFDGCTCNLRSIRHLDLSVGTAGLLCFPDMHKLINYIQCGKNEPAPTQSTKQDIVDQICKEYCGPQGK